MYFFFLSANIIQYDNQSEFQNVKANLEEEGLELMHLEGDKICHSLFCLQKEEKCLLECDLAYHVMIKNKEYMGKI